MVGEDQGEAEGAGRSEEEEIHMGRSSIGAAAGEAAREETAEQTRHLRPVIRHTFMPH